MALPRLARYPAMGGIIAFDALPAASNHEVIRIQAEDRGESRGILYWKGGEKTVVCLMHPRADMTRHYLTPFLLEGGYAVFGQEGRWPGNDVPRRDNHRNAGPAGNRAMWPSTPPKRRRRPVCRRQR